MLNQIAVGIGFREDLPHLMPLNEYVHSASAKMSKWLESQGEHLNTFGIFDLY